MNIAYTLTESADGLKELFLLPFHIVYILGNSSDVCSSFFNGQDSFLRGILTPSLLLLKNKQQSSTQIQLPSHFQAV